MLKPLKIDAPADRVFLSSDYHIRHARPWIVEARGFKTVEEHDEALIARWNAVVPTDGIVLHLGDMVVGAGNDGEGVFWELLRRLSFGHLYHLWGNHTSGAKQAYQRTLAVQYPDATLRGAEVYPLTTQVDYPGKQLTFLPEYMEVDVGKQRMVLFHYAIRSWHHMGKDHPHWFGHSHAALEHYPRCRDVGVDAYKGPVSVAQLMAEIAKEKPAKVDHH